MASKVGIAVIVGIAIIVGVIVIQLDDMSWKKSTTTTSRQWFQLSLVHF